MAQPYGGNAPAPVPTQPPRIMNLGTVLGMAALAISVVALVVSLTVPGPAGPAGTDGSTGPQGPQGPVGPAGPGTALAVNSTTDKVAIGSTCTNYAGAEVTVAVPRAGRVAVSANVMLVIGHTIGVRDNAWTMVSNDTETCTIDPSMGLFVVPADLPSDDYWGTVPIANNFTVPAAGSYTFYVNGKMDLGQNAGDLFYFAYLAAVFYPS